LTHLQANERGGKVPNAAIREAVEAAIASGELRDYADLSERLGWSKGVNRPRETSRIRRMLGQMKAHGGRKTDGGAYPPRLYTAMPYEQAVAVVRAINRDPHEFDL
jgi:hypothetical protein